MSSTAESATAAFSSSDPQVRQTAALCVADLDHAGLEALVQLLADPEVGVRRAAVDALLRLRRPGTNDLLRPLAEHPDQDVRKAALEVALRLGAAGASPRSARQRSMRGQGVGRLAAAFGIGLLTAAAVGGVIAILVRFDNTPVKVLSGSLAFGVLVLAMKGWSWMSEYGFGSHGYALKFLALLFVMMTFVGLIPILYWVGRGVVLTLDLTVLEG